MCTRCVRGILHAVLWFRRVCVDRQKRIYGVAGASLAIAVVAVGSGCVDPPPCQLVRPGAACLPSDANQPDGFSNRDLPDRGIGFDLDSGPADGTDTGDMTPPALFLGHVIEKDTVPVSDVRVCPLGAPQSPSCVITDSNGDFSIVSPGNQTASFVLSKQGFVDTIVTAFVHYPNNTPYFFGINILTRTDLSTLRLLAGAFPALDPTKATVIVRLFFGYAHSADGGVSDGAANDGAVSDGGVSDSEPLITSGPGFGGEQLGLSDVQFERGGYYGNLDGGSGWIPSMTIAAGERSGLRATFHSLTVAAGAQATVSVTPGSSPGAGSCLRLYQSQIASYPVRANRVTIVHAGCYAAGVLPPEDTR